jgi:predicted Zn-dependent protease
MEISTADLAPIRDLYGRGLYIQAQRAADQLGPLDTWTNTPARLLGGRLAIQLGGTRLGRWLHLQAYRATPSHPEAIYYHARYRLERFGPLAAWNFLRQHPDQDWYDAAPEVRADWYGLHSFVCARLRDFDRSDRWLSKAESLSHDRAWIAVERAAALEFAERYEEALAVARRSLELVPYFRPGVQAEAHLLQILGRDREALDHLLEASEHLESGIVVAHRAAIQLDLRHYEDARKSYELYAELSPWLDRESKKWLAARRSDVAYYCGDLDTAISRARESEEEFYTAFADRLTETRPPPAPIRLEVPPALVMEGDQRKLRSPLEQLVLSWNRPTDGCPTELMPPDGLPDPKERQWLEANGFQVVEFRCTPESSQAVLAAGCPFLLTLVDAGFNHSQLVVGMDVARQSLWMIDPTEGKAHEAPLKLLLDRYGSSGPRGLTVVPTAEAARLTGLDLPDRKAYDSLFQLQKGLHQYDRATALSTYETMKGEDPTHRLTRYARLALARYDANPTLLLFALDSLLALYPEDNTFLLAKTTVLRDLGRKLERSNLIRRQLDRKEADPLFAHHHAQSIMTDPDRLAEAEKVMRKAVRQRPYAQAGYYILGNIVWEQRRHQEATDLYRFAASLDDRDEQFAEAFFRASRVVEQTPEAMRFLQGRYDRTRGKLAGPARAMFYALSEQDEMVSAFRALEAPPPETPGPDSERGEALLFAAEMRTNYNEPEQGRKLLEEARALAPKATWERSAARQALVRVDLQEAKSYWEALLADDPLAIDVHRNLSRVIADLEGRSAAIAWACGLCERFPFHYPSNQLLIDWLRGEVTPEGETPAAEQVIRHLIDICPEDAWAQRELALHLANHNRAKEALEILETTKQLDPDNPSFLFTLGHALTRADKPDEAKEAYSDAIRRSVDHEVAILELMNLARGEEEREEALDFISEELQRQTHFSDGLLAFREQAVQAHDIIEPDDLLRLLQEIFDEHPDLWQAWSALLQQMVLCGRLEEARQLAKEGVERFPLLPRLWVDLAEICQAQEDDEGQIEALHQAIHVAPGWGYAARELADALENNKQMEEARIVLEQAVARTPLDPVNHGYLADNLWNSAEPADAIERLQLALRIDPGYEWAWRHLSIWTDSIEEPEKAAEVAREVCRLRPGDPRGWLALARILHGPQTNEEAIHALDRAIALNPHGLEAYDLKAERLAEMGRYDEAKESATPKLFEQDSPTILQGRAAWVEARRGNLPLACREMQALVAIEPTYYWGWQQLAEWNNELGRQEDFLEAAEKLVELRPENPIALAMRGDARLQLDDREGGKSDLREAQQLEPGYSYPGMLLFDACLQDEEYPQARSVLAVLDEHITGNGRPFVLARYVQLAAKTKDLDGAIESLRELVATPCESTWPLQAASTEFRQVGWDAELDEILLETLEKAEDFHPWTLMAWLESKAGIEASLETKLRLVQRVTEVHPRYVQAYDVMAELYTRLGRYDEALQACQPASWGDRMPQILRGRAAWVIHQRGERTAALARMRDLVTSDPDYFWGWQQLANWYDESGSSADYLDATENLVRLSPGDPTAYAYRGEARAANGDRRGAKADFKRSFELDPSYTFAGLSLCDSQLQDEELTDAQRTLTLLEEHVGGPHVMQRAVKLHTLRKDREAAREAFQQLMNQEEIPYFICLKSAEAMAEAGYSADVDEVLGAQIEREEIAPHVARLWIERAAAQGDKTLSDRLPELIERGGQDALYSAIDAYSTPSSKAHLHDLITRFGTELRSTNRGWAKIMVALATLGDYSTTATWGVDWRERDVDEPWMLHPLAASLRRQNRYPEAEEVSLAALRMEGEDAATPDFRIWIGFEEALNGRIDKAEQLTSSLDEEDFDDSLRLLLAMTKSLIQVQRQGRSVFVEERKKVETLAREIGPKEPNSDLTASYRRWATRMAQDAGGFAAWLWLQFGGRNMPK